MPVAFLPETGGKLRLSILLGVLSLVIVAGALHKVRVWRLERELEQIGLEQIEEQNRADPIPVPAEGPEADVEVVATCTFENVFFGNAVGKVTLVVQPRSHTPNQDVQEISYVYARDDDGWRLIESYSCAAEDGYCRAAARR